MRTNKTRHSIANFVYTEQSTNIKVGMMSPSEYFAKVKDEIAAKVNNISTIDSEELLSSNLIVNDIPTSILNASHSNYNDFLKERRVLMVNNIKEYYEGL
ncbi:hypothetical protein MKD41_15495 [Lutibacter sp. A64]|uniref:hypothetical protein n=1 Tax=Lutibacter sp. A64 TaxID=2918526 RepID=UPI001F05C2C9|nr:hypothetical protein [Lutibacter sp. A64]UMB53723.1 hypothetical protein MKD41_15495 [Lutibacter sp. A64]